MQLFTELHKQASQKFLASGNTIPIGTWLMEHTSLNRKPFSFKRYPFQERIANDMHPNLSCIKCSQIGLALSLDTPLPTPDGWTTMGEVQVGDTLFNEEGNPTKVTFKSETWYNRDCFKIEFDDGETIVADSSHRWYVKTHRGPFNSRGVFSGKGRPSKSEGYTHDGIVNTKFLFENFEKAKFYIKNTGVLAGNDVSLPIDPYILGVWLGDGCRHSATITIGDQDFSEMRQLFSDRGYDLVFSSEIQYRVPKLYRSLREEGHIGKKIVPNSYLRASVDQRLELLRGLMDSDGSITKKGRASFHNTEPELVRAVAELMRSLGMKPRIRWRKPDGSGFGGKLPIAEVSVMAHNIKLFNLQRKAERQGAANERERFTSNRTIVRVTQVESVPTECITVDSPSHLFLCGEGMIPTHNTEIQVRKFLAFLRRENGVSGIFTLPTEDMYKRVYTTRISPILRNDDVFNPPMLDKPARRQDLVQIGDSWGYITGCNEGPATSIPADILFHDELDLSDEAMIGLFQSRLQNSDYKITQAFSTPTYMGYGVDKSFTITDQYHYMVRCEKCNHHQFPMFEQDWVHIPNLKFEVDKLTDMTPEQITGLNLKETYIKCCKCHSRLDLGNTANREWVAKHPSRDNFRGYKVNPFSTDRISLEYIFTQLSKYKLQENEKGFHNTVLGESYSPASAQIPEEAIKACLAPHGRPEQVGFDQAVFMGIDMGAICHITIVGEHTDGKDPWHLFKTCHASQLRATISELQKQYNIVQACADRYPYTPEVDAIRENTHGVLMPVAYEGKAILAPKKDEVGNLIYYAANRTFALDMVRTSITSEAAVLGGYTSHKNTITAHLRDMVREETPEKEPKWVKLNGNDHFFHSMAQALLARRVAEHMFLHNLEDSAMTLSIIGMDIGKKNDPVDKFRNRGVEKYGFAR